MIVETEQRKLFTLSTAFFSAFRPPKRIMLSEWSDEYARLSSDSSADAGRWRTLPYQREMMDAMTDPSLEGVVVMKSARVGYTKCLNNLIGYHMHWDPAGILMVQPTIEDAEGYSKEEIAPMLRDTPVLKSLVGDSKAKDTSNTILHKMFPGGVLSLVGANSPRGFRRISRRIICFDEVDGFPVGGAGPEGDQISLGIKRSEYYWNRKIVLGSTPTDKGRSRIESAFMETDQRRFFVPCPHCGAMQYLRWGDKDTAYGIKWPKGKPRQAFYMCEACQRAIEHDRKTWMCENGVWRPTAESQKPRWAGFHIWAAYSYSPNATWANLAQEWMDKHQDKLQLKTFVNTALGETWEETAEARDPGALAARAEEYPAEVPARVALLTMAADVQQDRVEVKVKGWGEGDESWLIDYRIFYGDTSDQGTDVWDELDSYRTREWTREDGVRLRAPLMVIDSGNGREGYIDAVYHYCQLRQGSTPRVYAIKGVERHARPELVVESAARKNSIRLYTVATWAIKKIVFERLGQVVEGDDSKPRPGMFHFPKGMGEEYFKGLASEKLMRVKDEKKGIWVEKWVPTYDRNEPLDTEVYSFACLQILRRYMNPGLYKNMEALMKVTKGEVRSPVPVRRIRGSLRV